MWTEGYQAFDLRQFLCIPSYCRKKSHGDHDFATSSQPQRRAASKAIPVPKWCRWSDETLESGLVQKIGTWSWNPLAYHIIDYGWAILDPHFSYTRWHPNLQIARPSIWSSSQLKMVHKSSRSTADIAAERRCHTFLRKEPNSDCIFLSLSLWYMYCVLYLYMIQLFICFPGRFAAGLCFFFSNYACFGVMTFWQGMHRHSLPSKVLGGWSAISACDVKTLWLAWTFCTDS